MDIFGNAYNAGKSWPTTIVTSRQRYGCCGSGHILVEAYNVLKAIYEERGYRTRDIPKLILENNLFGLDIDDRAAQLAGFALLMKAREDDRRILTRNVRLNVLDMQSSQHLDANTLWRDLNLTGDWHQGQSQSLFDSEQQDPSSNDATYKLIADLIERFQDAKTFGSLIEVPHEWEAPLKALLKELSELTNSGDMMQKAAAQRLIPMVQQAWVLAQRYDTVVANPPYMGSKGMNKALKDYAKNAYPNSKSDLFAIFMEHGFSLLDENAFNAMVTMQSWMFLSSYEKMREALLENSTIETMVHMGNGVMKIAFGTNATVFRNRYIAGMKGSFSYAGAGDIGDNGEPLEFPVKNERLKVVAPDDFKKIPGSPVAYWVSEAVRNIFLVGEPLEQLSTPRQGLGTGNNAKFTRYWFEINQADLARGCATRIEALSSSRKWFPYTKGGGFKKWFGNELDVINWKNDGSEIKAALKGMNPNIPRSEEHYFKKGVTWGLITSSNFSARVSEQGAIFDVGGSKAMPSQENFFSVLGFLNSKISTFFLKTLNPTLNFQVGDIKKLPIVKLEIQRNFQDVVERLVEISQTDWDSKEVAMSFSSNSILFRKSNNIKGGWLDFVSSSAAFIEEMKELECQLNDYLVSLYGLKSIVTTNVSLKEVTLECNPEYLYGNETAVGSFNSRFQSDTLYELVSYAIGCMMGRYSLDKPGLIIASQGETIQDYFAQIPEPSFAPDDNAIIPLTDQEWFPDDATNRFRDFVRTVWGEEHLQENLDFVAESLCLHAIKPKKGEAALETIRRYLSTQFFKDHLRTYKKRPIYWLFSSGKQKAFECLVYLHRYNESTLAEMRTDYVIPLTTKLASYVEKLEQDKDASTSAAEAKSIEKELSKLYKQQAELNTFDEKLRHYADQRISLDLDDGVKVNYGKFGDLLAEVKAVTGQK